MSRIVRVSILPLRIVNAHLLIGASGCVLIDAGLPGSAAKFEKALSKQGMSFKDVQAIVVTHAHVDHAGAAAELRELTRAPIIAHEDDLRYYKREEPMRFCPTGWVGRLFMKTPAFKAFEPDVLLSGHQSLDLSRYGVSGTVKHTPGHTKGSISVELGSKEALVGDLVASGILIGGVVRLSRAIRPPFEDDPQAVRKELFCLVEAGVERFYIGHGGPLDASEVRHHAESLLRHQCF